MLFERWAICACLNHHEMRCFLAFDAAIPFVRAVPGLEAGEEEL
jgi:hypothetical protein